MEQKQEGGSRSQRREGCLVGHIPWAHGLTPPRMLGPEQGQETGSGHGKRAKRQWRDQEGDRQRGGERKGTVRGSPRS